MSIIRKAVITAAGRGTRQYPATSVVQKEMLPLVDRDGITKPVIQIIAEEALEAGIEEICIVVSPGDEQQFLQHFRAIAQHLLPAFAGKEWALRESEKLARIERALTYVVQANAGRFWARSIRAAILLEMSPSFCCWAITSISTRKEVAALPNLSMTTP